jgi:hypothetical protein
LGFEPWALNFELGAFELIMKYLCLVYLEEQKLRAVPDRECQNCGDGLRESGKVAITDGPFAETKEQLAGFYLIDASDLDEAIQVAAKIPPAREGSIEIRPVRELEP